MELYAQKSVERTWKLSEYSESLGYYTGVITTTSVFVLAFTVLPDMGLALYFILLISVHVLMLLGVRKFTEYLKLKKALDMFK